MQTPPASRIPTPLRRLAVSVMLPAAMGMLVVTGAPAAAASVCSQLEQRLAAVSSAPRADTARRLTRAIRLAQADGCGTYASPRDGICRAHSNRISRLRHAVGGGGSNVGHERMRLEAALRGNGCVGQKPGSSVRTAAVSTRPAAVDRIGVPLRTMDGSIPTPTPRPASPGEIYQAQLENYQAQYVEHGRSLQHAADLKRARVLAEVRPVPAERGQVRVVGGKFLPDPNEEMDFMTIATTSGNPVNEVLGSMLAAIEGTIVQRAVAAEP